MLDTDTKRRIDTARDILVGKVPDPKSQVEQITIALIYKFMDDMDAESEELGGKRKFFTGDFERFGWAKLIRSGLGGFEILSLYTDGIAKMTENHNLPPLFRDIFKNAYLPYRDPETLRSFLKVIDEFTYDHSERLGDAFEYLLSVLGSQGDAGQFRTPRHIIDFIVEITKPRKNETILDPACGTAGFLISAYKHIIRTNTDDRGQNTLTIDERLRLAENIKGYDISPDMVRLSLVNLYLHGFAHPNIYEYDTLTQEERWNEYADVILANPPFMSPKGGIRPHKRFSIQAKRSEVLFVDYMAEHLTPAGRAGIIVPEGIIFQSQSAYKDLRKMLVETSLVAVVSLPAGCFNPYSGVKTSILILDKSLARQAKTVAFFRVENDGYGLGAQRRPIDKNDLPQVSADVETYLTALCSGNPVAEMPLATGLVVPKEKIAANGEYNLSGERYREGTATVTTHRLVPVGQFIRDGVKTIDPRTSPDELFELLSIPAYDAGKPELLKGSEIGSQKKVVLPNDVLLSRIIPHIRRAWVVEKNHDGRRQIASTEWIVFSSDEILPGFLKQLLVSDRFHVAFMQTITGVGGSLSRANPNAVAEIQIPLPPLDVQKEIVAEIEGYQKVINGARTVLDNYRPHIPVNPDWPMVELGSVCEINPNAINPVLKYRGEIINYIDISSIENGTGRFLGYTEIPSHVAPSRARREVCDGDVLLSTVRPNLKAFTLLKNIKPRSIASTGFAVLRGRKNIAIPEFILSSIFSDNAVNQMINMMGKGAYPSINQSDVESIQIPLPPIETQRAIVAEIEAERALVSANGDLIARMEKKIQSAIARVWG